MRRSEEDDGIGVERGMRAHMSRNSGACRIVVRDADDPEAAAEALRRFRDDLSSSDVFAPLDGEFGNHVDGAPVRYQPSYVSDVEVGAEGPQLWFDAQDVLDSWPELAAPLLRRLDQRLRDAGVRRARIGKPRRPYWQRAYVAEADWFAGAADYLLPLDARWRPSLFPPGFPAPARAPVTVAHQARDASWAHAAWRRREPRDEFADAIDRWHRRGLVVEPMTGPPPDLAWGRHLVHRAFSLADGDARGWAWIVFSEHHPATDLHALWFATAESTDPVTDYLFSTW